MTKLFIAGFPKGQEENWFLELFSHYGRVNKTELVMADDRLECLGYGFIIMHDPIEAKRAINDLNNTVIHGHLVSVKSV